MSLAEIEEMIRDHIAASAVTPWIQGTYQDDPAGKLYVIKYTSPQHLSEILRTGKLFASHKPEFTWGDAVYVAPLAHPLSTMMYGAAGVVGWVQPSTMNFYDATDPAGIGFYQQWITHFPVLYRLLTTTVHANKANRALRNKFRSRFGIDCIYFRPDEMCVGYTGAKDAWLALTHWGNNRQYAASGPSGVVKDAKWCAITTESFVQQGLGFRALLHPEVSNGRRGIIRSGYKDLRKELMNAHVKNDTLVITEF